MNQDQPARMRTPLKWALAGTVLATTVSLLWPTHDLVGVQDSQSKPMDAPPLARQVASLPLATGTLEGGLTRLQPLIVSGAASAVAAFDPFVGLVPPPPPPAPPPVASPAAVLAPPSPPPQDFRFLGRVTDPDGIDQVLLSRGDTAVPIKVGTVLDNGYVVESIAADVIILTYPPLGIKTSLPVPKIGPT